MAGELRPRRHTGFTRPCSPLSPRISRHADPGPRRAGFRNPRHRSPGTRGTQLRTVWCAHAQLRPGVGAHGEGNSRETAIADLREALIGLIAEFGAPDELTLMLDVA